MKCRVGDNRLWTARSPSTANARRDTHLSYRTSARATIRARFIGRDAGENRSVRYAASYGSGRKGIVARRNEFRLGRLRPFEGRNGNADPSADR